MREKLQKISHILTTPIHLSSPPQKNQINDSNSNSRRCCRQRQRTSSKCKNRNHECLRTLRGQRKVWLCREQGAYGRDRNCRMEEVPPWYVCGSASPPISRHGG